MAQIAKFFTNGFPRESFCRMINPIAASMGLEILMYPKLARRLVDERQWYTRPLNSGIQTPLISALEYLTKIKDKQSVPRLEELLECYIPLPRERDDRVLKKGQFAHSGEQMPSIIQGEIVRTILALLSRKEAELFIVKTLVEYNQGGLDVNTLRIIAKYAIQNEMRDISVIFLSAGKRLKNIFYGDLEISEYLRKGIYYNNLYGYEELMYGAFMLCDGAEKAEALEILINEYNNPQAGKQKRLTHEYINLMMCRIVNEKVPDREQASIFFRLNSRRYMEDFRRYMWLRQADQQFC